MMQVARTLRAHRELILNWFRVGKKRSNEQQLDIGSDLSKSFRQN